MHLDDFLGVIFVVQTVTENVPKGFESSLDPICDRLFLGLASERRSREAEETHLVESRTFGFLVVRLTTADILMPATVLKRDSDDRCDIDGYSTLLVHIDLPGSVKCSLTVQLLRVTYEVGC